MRVARRAFCVVALVGAVAGSGCAAPGQQPIAPATSWTSSRPASGSALLYLSDVRTNDVDVFSYPQRKLVGTLKNFGAPRSECGDREGNVWIADQQGYDVIEYAHGGSKPLVALSTPWRPRGCAVSANGNAIAVAGGKNSSILAIFHRSTHKQWRDATKYSTASIREGYFCGYDAHGNLFVDGLDKANGGTFRLAELRRGAKALMDVTVSQNIVAPGQVQWDGSNVAIGDSGASPSVIYRFSISRRGATLTGSTVLAEAKSVRGFWIDGTRLIGPDFDSNVGIWKYPAGGSPITEITSVRGFGAVVSPVASSSRK